jgi:hypothetical protein
VNCSTKMEASWTGLFTLDSRTAGSCVHKGQKDSHLEAKKLTVDVCYGRVLCILIYCEI